MKINEAGSIPMAERVFFFFFFFLFLQDGLQVCSSKMYSQFYALQTYMLGMRCKEISQVVAMSL